LLYNYLMALSLLDHLSYKTWDNELGISDAIFPAIGQEKDVIIAQLTTQVALQESELKDARDLAERATTDLERWRNTAQSVREREEAILYLLAKQGWHVCIVPFLKIPGISC
jgi:hypothetical protein